jgi:hypothetical protein
MKRAERVERKVNRRGECEGWAPGGNPRCLYPATKASLPPSRLAKPRFASSSSHLALGWGSGLGGDLASRGTLARLRGEVDLKGGEVRKEERRFVDQG